MCMLMSPSPAWQESDFMKQHGQRMREIQREKKKKKYRDVFESAGQTCGLF